MTVIIQGDQLRSIAYGVLATRPATTVPNSGAGATTLYTVTGGRVILRGLVAEVTTIIGGTTPALTVTYNPTGAGASTALAAATAITDDAVGTQWAITGDVSDDIQTGLWAAPLATTPLVLAPGTIEVTSSAANTTGAAKWSLLYIPLDNNASVSVP